MKGKLNRYLLARYLIENESYSKISFDANMRADLSIAMAHFQNVLGKYTVFSLAD